MRRVAPAGVAVGMFAMLLALVAGGLAPNVAAIGPDKSDVVMEFDFSSSITIDKTTRTKFAGALNAIAGRVEETKADLVRGDTTVSLVWFATSAKDVPGCVEIQLLQSPSAVDVFAGCLRTVASAYANGGKAVQRQVGTDTNYIAALQQAKTHIPDSAVRPAVIFFTDGKHDVPGGNPPASAVVPARDQLFGNLPSFALLPVGMGLDPTLRGPLTKGLEDLRVVKGIPDCAGTTNGLEWPTVVFTNPADAGNAVGVALADTTCTFTVAPTPTPPAAPIPKSVTGIQLTPGNGKIDVSWVALPPSVKPAVTDYVAQCRPADSGEWVQSKTEGNPLIPKRTIDGLTNGTTYECQVASVSKDKTGVFTSGGTATPLGPPAAPAAPTVTAGNGTLDVAVPPQTDADRITFECASNPGASPAIGEADAKNPTAQIAVPNGISYQCRAIAANAVGTSDPSGLSATAFPCNGFLQCTPSLLPIIGGGIGILVLGIVIAVFLLYRGRQKGHVIAVVDVVHTANIGHGTSLGVAFVQSPETRKVTGIVAERGRKADVRIRRLRHGRFEVRDKAGSHVVGDGDPVVVLDSVGGRHSLTLQAFSTNAASQVATRR